MTEEMVEEFKSLQDKIKIIEEDIDCLKIDQRKDAEEKNKTLNESIENLISLNLKAQGT